MSRQKPNIPRNRHPCDLPVEQSTASFWHSEPSALLTGHRSTRDLPTTADVVMIGSGMTGTSVAHHLLANAEDSQNEEKKGLNVVMLEAREACWGATGRNGGHCQPLLLEHPHDPSIPKFELANFHALQNLISSHSIDCEFVAQPAVRAIYSSRDLTDIELALLTIQENTPELAKLMRLVTTKPELEKLRVPTAVGAVVTSVAARMWPYKFVSHILENLLTSTNVNGSFNLQTLTPVTNLSPSSSEQNNWTVTTPRGTITASKVVLATNAYTSHLLPSFADLIIPCRGQMSALQPLPSVAGANRLTTSYGFLGDGLDDYLIQRPNERGGHLMFGGGRQNGPSVGTVDDNVVEEKTAQYLRRRLVEVLDLPEGKRGKCHHCIVRKLNCTRPTPLSPCRTCTAHKSPCLTPHSSPQNPSHQTSFTPSHEWTGIMGFSRDDLPWVGPVPSHPNLYVAAGFTGHGMPNTWLCGKAVALMVGGGSVEEVGLPRAYLVSEERMERAMELEDVEVREWAEMERGRRRGEREGDRPPSGYA